MNKSKPLPKDVMDYICKSMAYFSDMIPNTKQQKKKLEKLGNPLLDKYDFPSTESTEKNK